VAVSCRRCGREYDPARFESGRTLWCTCGSRVGVLPRADAPAAAAEPRFLADAMLGRLARWLRILGFDCAFDGGVDDGELVRRAAREGRIVLSRDRSLPQDWWVPGIHLVGSEDLREQLREIVRRFDLAGSVRLLSRCAECNEPLRPAREAGLSERVPPHAYAAHRSFLECPCCGRVYWEGSHVRRIRRLAGEALGREPERLPPQYS
jgi:hypothetical protein